MTIDLKQRAQKLFWAAQELEESGGQDAAATIYEELARLHQELADGRARRGDPGAWIDVFAAITCLAKAGDNEGAEGLISEWRIRSEVPGSEDARQELDALEQWLADPSEPHHHPSTTTRPWADLPERLVLSWLRHELTAA